MVLSDITDGSAAGH